MLAGFALGSIVEKHWGNYFYFMVPFGLVGSALMFFGRNIIERRTKHESLPTPAGFPVVSKSPSRNIERDCTRPALLAAEWFCAGCDGICHLFDGSGALVGREAGDADEQLANRNLPRRYDVTGPLHVIAPRGLAEESGFLHGVRLILLLRAGICMLACSPLSI